MRSLLTMNLRQFSAGYNYTGAANSKVFMDVSKDGNGAGRMVFELYENHAPHHAANFAAFCSGATVGNRSFSGSSLCHGITGFGVHGGMFAGENTGCADERVADENLHLRHHKRGMLTMINDGPHSSGSQFMVTFGEAHHLDGY